MKSGQVACLSVILLALLKAPLVAEAQESPKAVRVGWMSRGGPAAKDANLDAFRQGMRELGYVEGKSFVIEPRYAEGNIGRMPEQAAQLERLGVAAIIAGPFEALV